MRRLLARALVALCVAGLVAPPAAAQDALAIQAKNLAVQARTAAAAQAALPRDRFDGSIVALGDSITANTLLFNTGTTSNSDSWLTKGIFTMLVARSGGRLRPVKIAGWPYKAGVHNFAGVAEIFVARGGSGYTGATTLSFQTGVGGSGAAATPIIQNGVITGVTVTNEGANYAQSPIVTATDSGGGSGAVFLAQLRGAGEYAVGGIGTIEMEAYLPLILNGGNPVARNVLFLGGTNNYIRGIGLADSKASILSICQRLTAGGVRVIAVAPLDREGSAGAQARRQASALRWWYMEQLPALVPGVVVVDPSPWISDPATNNFLTGISADGLHPSAFGADVIATQIWNQIAALFPGVGPKGIASTNADLFDATYNPQGNLLTQPMQSNYNTATPNASTEAPWTGTRMPGIFLSRVSGGTGTASAVASVPARTDGRGGNYQLLTVSITGAAAGETYRLTWTTNGAANTLSVGGGNTLQVGDTVRAAIDEVVMSNVAGLRGMKLKLLASNVAAGYPVTPTGASAVANASITGTAAWGDWEDGNFPAWSGDTLFLQTRELVIPASTTYLTMHLDFVVNAGAASFTAKLYGASIRRLN